MKIAFVRKIYTPFGGAERYLSQLIDRLAEQGHEVHIFAHKWETGPRERKGNPLNPTFHRVPMIGAPSFLEALSFALFSRRLLQQEEFEVIHSFERTLYQDVYRAGDGCHREWLLQREKIDPWYKTASHPLNPLHRTLLFLERRMFASPRLKRIVANSQRGKAEIMRHYGVAENKIEVIYNGVDLETYHPRNRDLFHDSQRREMGIPEEGWVILFLGSGFRRKGLGGLIDAFAKVGVEIPGAVLIVAGKDRHREYRDAARKLGMEKRVHFLGPTQKAKELYAISDLFALPTLYDPFSNACLEAMATGVPVLTSYQNGVSELIADGKNGLLVSEATDSSSIAEKIRRFYHAPDRNAWRAEARRVSEEFSIERAVNRLLDIYAELRKPGNA
jgi:UDP-glucose:(heptosyl)LPS alpha-1,3-glucosyltransferase